MHLFGYELWPGDRAKSGYEVTSVIRERKQTVTKDEKRINIIKLFNPSVYKESILCI